MKKMFPWWPFTCQYLYRSACVKPPPRRLVRRFESIRWRALLAKIDAGHSARQSPMQTAGMCLNSHAASVREARPRHELGAEHSTGNKKSARAPEGRGNLAWGEAQRTPDR